MPRATTAVAMRTTGRAPGLGIALALSVLACVGVVVGAAVLAGNGEILPALAGPLGVMVAWLLFLAVERLELQAGALWDWASQWAVMLLPPVVGLASAIALRAP